MIPLLTTWLERMLALFPPLIGLYALYYKGLVEKEVHMGHISPGDKVLCIGGGPLPCTAMEIARTTGAKVDVVDTCSIAVGISRNIIKHRGLDEQITIRLARGEELNCSDYTVIHVARQVQPRHEVLANIRKNARRGARIILRLPHQSLQLLYQTLDRRCWHVDCLLTNNNCKETSLLLINQGGSMV